MARGIEPVFKPLAREKIEKIIGVEVIIMDKSMYNMKAEKIQKQVKLGDYQTAAKICDTIDWTQVRSARMLSLVSSVYEHVGQYDTAIDILLMAYEETPTGRRLLYKLTELAILAGAIEDAEEWYNDYLDEAPDDNARYILRYKLAVAKDEPIDKKIASLEAFRRQEMDEKWGYELAKLYDEAGDGANCVSLCDELILYFGSGKYVDQAKILRSKYSGEQVVIEDEMPAVAIASEAESGQQVSALDMSVFLPEDDEVQEDDEEEEESENVGGKTKRVSAKDDFSKTRIFTKLPANTAELQIFNTVTAPSVEQPSEVVSEETPDRTATFEPQKEEPAQMSLNFEADANAPAEEIEIPREPIEVSHIIYLGVDDPYQAVPMALEKIKEAHYKECTEPTSITKIAAGKLNSKGIINSLIALVDKDLIILGASKLDDGILSELKKASEELDKKKFFVLADSVERIKTVKDRYESQGIEEEAVSSLASAVSEIELEEAAESLTAEPEVEEEIPEIQIVEEPANEPEAIEPEVEEPVVEEPVVEEIPIVEEAPVEEIIEEPVVEEPVEEIEEEMPVEEMPGEDDIKIFIPGETEVEEPAVEEVVEEEIPEIAISEEPTTETEVEEPATEEIAEQPAEDTPAEEAPVEETPAEETPAEASDEERVHTDAIVKRRIEHLDARKIMDPEEFLEYIKKYMKSIDCVLANGAEEDLLIYIKELAEDGEKLNSILAEEMVETAADDAEGHSFGNFFRSRYDEDGNLILRAKHFI